MNDVEVLRAFERAPLRSLRPAQLETVTAHPRRTIGRLVERGVLAQIAKGVYTLPPNGRDARTWKPTLEASGLAVATVRFGNRNAVLMGIGAARHWTAIPRAVGVTTVAIPEAGRPPIKLQRGGTLYLIPRDVSRLDAILEQTELGPALVTTVEQTLFDLLAKPNQGRAPELASEAVVSLMARANRAELAEIVRGAAKVPGPVRETLGRLEGRDGQS